MCEPDIGKSRGGHRTISTLIAELVERGLVREGNITRNQGIGRPSQAIQLDPYFAGR